MASTRRPNRSRLEPPPDQPLLRPRSTMQPCATSGAKSRKGPGTTRSTDGEATLHHRTIVSSHEEAQSKSTQSRILPRMTQPRTPPRQHVWNCNSGSDLRGHCNIFHHVWVYHFQIKTRCNDQSAAPSPAPAIMAKYIECGDRGNGY
ncbi:hypothetical protein IQ07DRAFT_601534 [Pyrenochaeta sp. DS3sAY3a]|nr:hypothetical protein IQ07DRAFT_601534 [Pyrenochaeta sp. DS3sAY3a]